MDIIRVLATAVVAATSTSLAACATPVGAPSVPRAASDSDVAKPGLIASDIAGRAIQDEVIYFVLPDRFANGDVGNDRGGADTADRLEHGYDPEDYGFFHGGDLKGLTERLDYIQGLGVTAIWLTPVFENRPVQGPPGLESAGYHGYWITDFTTTDPHLGTRAEFKAFVDAAHARGMKVYMDIITNHTADVIAYRECHDPDWTGERVASCDYRYIGDYPWTTRGGPDGPAINDGFLGDDAPYLTDENYAALKDPNWAYTPYVPDGWREAKTPAWLNDPIYYHNRGNTDFIDEDSLYGDFVGLDDLNTEHPRVLRGMIDIYKGWISDFGVDGFRIDTVKHVRDEFWVDFSAAILDHAKAEGIEHFHLFGEVSEERVEPQHLARFTTQAGLPAVLDFSFQAATELFVVHGAPGYDLMRFYAADAVYADGEATARRLPTFLGNHDMGRLSGFLRAEHPDMSDDEMLARLRLANGLMFFGRGVPTIYYGDEQGFVSDGNDRLAREDMFASQTDIYNDNDLVGTDATTADENFDTSHPLYRMTANFAAIRAAEPALRHGQQLTRYADREDSVFVFSRIDRQAGVEIVVGVNAEATPQRVNVPVDGRAQAFSALVGACAGSVSAVGSYHLEMPALGLIVCKSEFGAS